VVVFWCFFSSCGKFGFGAFWDFGIGLAFEMLPTERSLNKFCLAFLDSFPHFSGLFDITTGCFVGSSVSKFQT